MKLILRRKGRIFSISEDRNKESQQGDEWSDHGLEGEKGNARTNLFLQIMCIGKGCEGGRNSSTTEYTEYTET